MSDIGPLLSPIALDKRQYELVLLLRPGPLHELRVEYFLPPMQALHVGAPIKALCDLLPILAIVSLNGPSELLVLLRRPVALIGAVLVLGRPGLVDAGVVLLALDNFQPRLL